MKRDDLTSILDTMCWDIRCINLDDTWMWQVVGHYMAKPHKRVLGESREEEGVSKAVEIAVDTTKKDQYNYLFEFKEK